MRKRMMKIRKKLLRTKNNQKLLKKLIRKRLKMTRKNQLKTIRKKMKKRKTPKKSLNQMKKKRRMMKQRVKEKVMRTKKIMKRKNLKTRSKRKLRKKRIMKLINSRNSMKVRILTKIIDTNSFCIEKYISRFLKLIEMFTSIAVSQSGVLGMVLKVANPQELTILVDLLVYASPRHGMTIIKILDNLIRIGIPHELFDESVTRLANVEDSLHHKILSKY